MALADDLERVAIAAQRDGDGVSGILATELLDGSRVYLCGYESGAWLALGDDAQPIVSRRAVHDAAGLAGLCEVAEDALGPEPTVPRLASNTYLDELGAAARRAEREAGMTGPSQFGAVLESAFPAVEELAAQIIARHLTPLT